MKTTQEVEEMISKETQEYLESTTDALVDSLFDKVDDITAEARLIIEGATLEQVSERFSKDKSTVHHDVTMKLQAISPTLHAQVKEALRRNRIEGPKRGLEKARGR
jgi:cell division protein YceG involved in septum cleavage